MSFRQSSRGTLFSGAVLLVSTVAVSVPASAATVDYTDLFKTKVMRCLHPTVSVDKATYELVKGPDVTGETTTVRFKIFYDGMIRKNSMDADMMVRQAGSIRQMMVKVLADSGPSVAKCAMTTTWTDF